MPREDLLSDHLNLALVDGPIYRVGMSTGWWFHIRAETYEEAVVWLESWCIENGVQRRGAEFVKSDDMHFEGDERVVVVQRGLVAHDEEQHRG